MSHSGESRSELGERGKRGGNGGETGGETGRNGEKRGQPELSLVQIRIRSRFRVNQLNCLQRSGTHGSVPIANSGNLPWSADRPAAKLSLTCLNRPARGAPQIAIRSTSSSVISSSFRPVIGLRRPTVRAPLSDASLRGQFSIALSPNPPRRLTG